MVDRQNPSVLVRLLQPLKTLFHIIFCFIVMYLFLLIFLLPILFLISVRFMLSIIFSTFYGGKYKLIKTANACVSVDRFANVWTLSVFSYLDGPCDMEFLRRRVHQVFTTFKGKKGSRPYEVMLCGLVTKFGFLCWENMRDSFDIKHHIRYLPGCSDPNRIYTETEMLEAAANLIDDLWPESKPRWEFLVVPKMKRDGSDVVCSAIYFRFHHAYVDGVSMAQTIRLCVADKPAPEFMFDPVNPPIPPMPLWMKLITYLQVIFLGPWATLRLTSKSEHNAFCEGPLVGGKYFGRTKMDMPIQKMREIRRFYNCSTTAIEHYVFTEALRKLAERKGFPIPDEVLVSMIFALLPYPHEYPQNHMSLLMEKSPIGVNGLDRLHAMHKLCSRTAHPMNYYALLTSRLFMQAMGLFPLVVLKKFFGMLTMTYLLSNVPAFKDTVYFNGNSIVNMFGVGALINGIRYGVGVSCYESKLVVGFVSEQSALVETREDFNYLIEQFENEMKMLMDSVSDSAI